MTDHAPEPGQEEIVPVEDIDEFVRMLTHWHNNRMARLRNMQEVPEGTEIELEEGVTLTLTGDALRAYRIAMDVALSEFAQLPFVAIDTGAELQIPK